MIGIYQRREREGVNMKKILLVIDMQNDFVDGVLGTQEAVAIVPDVVAKIKEYPLENIIATRDTHGDDYMETSEGKHLPVIHCVKDTDGWQLNPSVGEALSGAKIINKPYFGSKELVETIGEMTQTDEIAVELIGICTDICVVSNAMMLKSALPEMEIVVDSKCCAGVTPESHEAALLTMKMCQITVK